MWQAVTWDVKFTSHNPAQKFHFGIVCQKRLSVSMYEEVTQKQID